MTNNSIVRSDDSPFTGIARRKFLKTTATAALGFACGASGFKAEASHTGVEGAALPFDQHKGRQNAKGNSYYLSSAAGNDKNDGTINAPWKTLSKISSVSLLPGDRVYFKKGDRFDGHFVVSGAGSDKYPVVISSYGTGPKPVITGEVGSSEGGDYREAIYINNVDNIVLDGLEVNNERKASRAGVTDVDAYGVYVNNTGTKVMKNFILRNMTFQNVYAVKPMLAREDFDHLEVAAVHFASAKNTRKGEEKNIQNVLIEKCYFTNIQRLGINFTHGGGKENVGNDSINRNMDLVVRNNKFHYLGGTCVLPQATYNCLIENNLFDHPGASVDPRMPGRGSSVWPIHCITTVIQHNQCLSIRGYEDSDGLHIDHENVNTFIQYNYMKDCEGGFVEILGGNVNSVYRFNVSVNDGWRKSPPGTPVWKQGHTLWISGSLGKNKKSVPPENTYIYNNTVYVDKDFPTAIDIRGHNTFIYNNIFCCISGGKIGGEDVVVKNNETPFYMSNNLFYGTIDGQFEKLDRNPIRGNPQFSGRGSDFCQLQLSAGSPAINQGVAKRGPAIPGAGTGVFKNVPPYPTVDFYGNPVDMSVGTPNVGACNAKNGETLLGSACP